MVSCPQATHQPEAETSAGSAAADTGVPSTGTGRPDIGQVADAQPVRTPEEQVGKSADNANPPQPTTVGAGVYPNAAKDTGLDAQISPAASPVAADTASVAHCQQATHQPDAETPAGCAARDTDQPSTQTG